MSEKKRIDSFDILKTISIFLVVFCHYTVLSNNVADNFVMSICFVAVPIFFMVNGALLMKKPFDLKKHIFKILSVYSVATIWRIIYLLIFTIKSDTFMNILNLKQQTFSYIFLWSNSSLVSVGHMWFMKDLLAVYLLLPILQICFQNGKIGRQSLYFLLVVIFVGFMCKTEFNLLVQIINKQFKTNIIVSADHISSFIPYSKGTATFFFVIGALLTQRLDGYENHPKINITPKLRIIFLLCFIASWVLLMWSKFLTDGTWKWNGITYNSGYTRIPTILVSVFLFLLLYDITFKKQFIRTCFKTVSSYTLGIYYLHWCLLPFILPFFTSRGLFPNTFKTIITVAISLLIIGIVKYIPIIRKLVK